MRNLWFSFHDTILNDECFREVLPGLPWIKYRIFLPLSYLLALLLVPATHKVDTFVYGINAVFLTNHCHEFQVQRKQLEYITSER